MTCTTSFASVKTMFIPLPKPAGSLSSNGFDTGGATLLTSGAPCIISRLREASLRLGNIMDGFVSFLDRRSLALAWLIFAAMLVCGTYLRVANIGLESEMSSDEGAEWAATSAPTVAEVRQVGAALSPRKLGFYDVMLHYWIRIFGDSLFSMRMMSAVLGVLDVLLLILVVLELSETLVANTNLDSHNGALTIALYSGALMAINLTMIKYSREIRMCPLMLALLLLQIWSLMVVIRYGKIEYYLSVAALSALALAANLIAAVTIVAELIWLLRAAFLQFSGSPIPKRRVWPTVAALGAGSLIFLVPAVAQSHHFVGGHRLEFACIERASVWGLVHILWEACGKLAFPVMITLSVWGAIQGWRRKPHAIGF